MEVIIFVAIANLLIGFSLGKKYIIRNMWKKVAKAYKQGDVATVQFLSKIMREE